MVLHPAGTGEALELLWEHIHAAGDDQHVVGELCPTLQVDGVLRGLDAVDLVKAHLDALVQLVLTGLDELLRIGVAERDEQQPRLVEVAIVTIHDGDLGAPPIHLLQAIGGQRAAGAATEDDNSMAHREDPSSRLPLVRACGAGTLFVLIAISFFLSLDPLDPMRSGSPQILLPSLQRSKQLL